LAILLCGKDTHPFSDFNYNIDYLIKELETRADLIQADYDLTTASLSG